MIVGHERIIAYLEKAWRKGRLAHAYCFHGPKHAGKTTVALGLVRMLVCEEPAKFGGCGTCRECAAVEERKSFRLTILEAGKPILAGEKTAREEIGIREVREVRRSLGLKERGWRIILIQEAHQMTADAANAFLKILEEPGENVLFLFLTSAPDYLLLTVKSRLVPIAFFPVSDAELMKISGATKELVSLAVGLPGMLITLRDDAGFRREETALHRAAEELLRGSKGDAVRLSGEYIGDEEKRNRLIRHALTLAEKKLRENALAETRGTVPRLKTALRALELAETTNVNPRLAADILFMNLAGY